MILLCLNLVLAAGSGKDAARQLRRLTEVLVFGFVLAFVLCSVVYGQSAAVSQPYPQAIDEVTLTRFLGEAPKSWQVLRKGFRSFQADCSIETTVSRPDG